MKFFGFITLDPKWIDIITNIVAFVAFFWEPVRAYLLEQPFEWWTFIQLVLVTIVGYFTGKSTKAYIVKNGTK